MPVMRRTGTALVLVVLGYASGGPVARGQAQPPPDLARLRGAARDALETTCGRCHDGAQPTARPAAVRIFDLHDENWSAGLTLEQMDHMVARFEGFKMPTADRVTVQRFFDAERARRASLPAPVPPSGPTR